ncbi:MAG: acetylornithine/succinylornithine family transaminase [Candidatus Altiarchaeales archaeon]|nr:acetylornithine/succinylornithine family transaminase [Candidatus Altiarchaeales archaeon]
MNILSMDLIEAIKAEDKHYSNLFNRLNVDVVRGQGCYLYDCFGEKYLDMYAGIAVCSVGHCHPHVTKAICDQAQKLVHTSNWVYTEPQLRLAEKITSLSGLDKVFFTNSGTEAVEAAIKLVRAKKNGGKIVSCKKSFHGRTLGALSATWNPRYREPFEPLIPGFEFIDYGDLNALDEALTEESAAFIVEPILGEAGVVLPPTDYLKEARELTREKGVLLVLDEVQTGFGRTGEWFGFQHDKINPDIICTAKGLGGGFPVGALITSGEVDFLPGQHGGTFGGNPLACATAEAVIEVIENQNLLDNAKKMGTLLREGLIQRGLNCRGLGLMTAFEAEGRQTVEKLLTQKILTINADKAVRLLPPLTLNQDQVEEFFTKLDKIT